MSSEDLIVFSISSRQKNLFKRIRFYGNQQQISLVYFKNIFSFLDYSINSNITVGDTFKLELN